ncbi:acyl-CoA dehydrogenase family protein [Streptomyces sp. NPDC017936]|uniref:acyl-CoA dehydrogenase family protein n=1 Tax=Streptomyces sp. NPDC017936 TaxID=3365016 RepID=UPI0037B7E4BD
MMLSQLSPEQQEAWHRFKAFAEKQIAPYAAGFDASEAVPADMIAALAEEGLLASVIAPTGGTAADWVTYGLMSEELGHACQNIRNFVAVTDMVASAVDRWGGDRQRHRWVEPIRRGEVLAAFALTEPEVGSDAASIETVAEQTGDGESGGYVLNGRKKWISFGQTADLFLVFAQLDGKHTAFLVPRETPGLTVRPITGLLGLRGSMLGELVLDSCRLGSDALLGRPGMGLTFIASTSLDLGRYSTAWGSVGLARACLEASVRRSDARTQYGGPISGHQLVGRMLADMVTDVTATRLLCLQAGLAKDHGEPDAVNLTLMAKYRASLLANQAAADTVQIHGAQGIGTQGHVERHFRDAKVMEIIEGTTQIQQTMLGQFARRLVTSG